MKWKTNEVKETKDNEGKKKIIQRKKLTRWSCACASQQIKLKEKMIQSNQLSRTAFKWKQMVSGMSAIVVDTLVPGNIFFLFFLHLASFLQPVSIFYIISNTKSLIPLLKTNPTIVECVVMTFSLLAVFVVHLICPNVLNVANGHFGIY